MNSRTIARTLVAAIAATALWIPGFASAALETVESATVVPALPGVCDSVQLIVAGSLPNSCYSIRGFRVGVPELLPTMGPIPTYRIPVRIIAEEPNPALERPCTAAIEPYRLAEDLGRLRFGFYWVDATEYLYPFPADSTSPIDSSKVRYTFSVASDTCRTGEGCVLLGFAATGFDYPRVDGCTARANPGEHACFDVTLQNPIPVGALQTEIRIPLVAVSDGSGSITILPVPFSVTTTPRAAGFDVAWTADGSTAKIVLYSARGLSIAPGRGAVLHVCYDVKVGTSEMQYPLFFANALVSSPAAEVIPFCPTFAAVWGRICVGTSHCDLNGDGVGDVRDIVLLVRCILSAPDACPDSLRNASDCNGDGTLDVRDIVCCVRDILGRDGGWGPDAGPGGAPSVDVARVGFEGEATWANPLEGRAVISIDRGRLFGGVQFKLYSHGLAEVRNIALEDPQGAYALQWEAGADGGARVMVYDRGFIEAGSGAPARAGAVTGTMPPVRLLLTLGSAAAGADDGGLAIRALRGATSDGAALSVEGAATELNVPANSVAGVASILPARPNPFVTETEISFALPSVAHASVRLFDVHGRLVRTLHEGTATAGVHRMHWDGRDNRGRNAGVGIYFVRFTSGTVVRTERILRLR